MLLILAVKLPFEANGGAAPAATAAVDVCSSPAAAFTLRDGSAMPCLASGTGGRTDAATDTRYTAVRLAIAAGVRHIDTAEIYLDEEVVGRAIREAAVARERVWLTTKLSPREFNHTAFALDGVAKGGPSFAARLHAAPLRRGERAETLLALRGSLHRLGMSFVDHYMVHRPIAAQLVVQWRAMLEARSLGLARSVGVSEYTPSHLELLRAADLELPAVNEVVFNPWEANWTTYAYCRAHGIRISGYRPLGAFAKWSEPPLPAVARAHNKSVAQILLRWALQKGVVPIFGSDSERHVRADVDIFDFTLTADELDGVTNMGLRETGLCRFWDGAVARMAPCRNDDVQR